MVTKTITLSVPEELLEWIDKAKGDVTRSKWMCRVIETKLKQKEKSEGGRS